MPQKKKSKEGVYVGSPAEYTGLFHKDSSRVHVFFLGARGSRALAYQRCVIPAKYLARAKIAQTAVMFGSFTKEAMDWADVVVLQRVGGRTITNVAKYCKMLGKAVIFDLDDDIFNYPDSPEYKDTDTDQIAKEITAVWAECNAIVTTEETIAESASYHTDLPIYVIPNTIDFEDWEPAIQKNYSHSDFLIGWAGGHYHTSDISLIVEPMSKILDEYKDVKLAFIGACPPALLDKYPERVLFHQFIDIYALPDLLCRMRFTIGLAPLAENKFANARSNLRLLQHSVLSIPTIASNFGPYQRSYEENFPMIVVENTTDAWFGAVRRLIEDKEQREFLGSAAREYTWQRYRAENLIPKWSGLVKTLRDKA